jgi:hypothetical protein
MKGLDLGGNDAVDQGARDLLSAATTSVLSRKESAVSLAVTRQINVDFHLPPALNTRIVSPMLSVEELGLEIASLSAHLDAATHRLLSCIRQFDEQCGWYQQGAVSCAHWLAWRVGLDGATAREKVRVARALGKLPAIDHALSVGKLSYAKVRALTRVATPENEARLLELALYATGAQLERLCRGFRSAQAADEGPAVEDRCVRKRVLPGGMVKLEIVLAPDEAEMVMRAIDCARGASEGAEGKDEGAEEARWPSRADGMVRVEEAFLAGDATHGTGGDRYQVMVHVDQDPLAADGVMAATLEDGTGVSAETLRRIACDCGLVAVTGNDPADMSVGRRTRSIPPTIRRALLLRDRGCCFPGCTHTRFLHGHHWRHWLHGGETSLANLLLLCPSHHRLVHEGGWSVEHDDAGAWTFIAPTGKSVSAETPRAWVGDILTWLQEWADEQGLDLGPDVNEPLWDGTRPDYDYAVSALLAAG